MVFDFLEPVEQEVADVINTLSSQHLGKKISFHTSKEFPNLEQVKLAFFGIYECRGAHEQTIDLIEFRKEFYALFPGNWEVSMADLGNVLPGRDLSDTYYAVTELVSTLLKMGIHPIIIGGSQDLTYPIYRSFDKLDQMVNLVGIDAKFDFGKDEVNHTAQSYLSKMIINEPHNLFNFSNLGYQTYYNPQEEIDLMDKLYFDAYRLGDVTQQLSLAEPVIRDADILSFDITSVKSMENGSAFNFMPNGFSGKEACVLARYAGLSEKLKVFSIFNVSNNKQEAVLLSQMIWYFIEGFHFRRNELPSVNQNNFVKFIVLVDDLELIFVKSLQTDRWWMEVPNYHNLNNKAKRNTLMPCSHEEYLEACDQEIPERWWKAQRKSIT
ncbi:MAG: formimidoylglutamase [Flavobacterium sp.]